MKNILKYEDLLEIEAFLRENEMDNDRITIVMGVETQQRLNRINNDYYHKINSSSNSSKEDVDSVNIKIGNVLFTYKLTNRDEDSM